MTTEILKQIESYLTRTGLPITSTEATARALWRAFRRADAKEYGVTSPTAYDLQMMDRLDFSDTGLTSSENFMGEFLIWFQEMPITRRTMMLAMPRKSTNRVALTVACAVCGTEFQAERKSAKYCSAACRQKASRAKKKAETAGVTDEAADLRRRVDQRISEAATEREGEAVARVAGVV